MSVREGGKEGVSERVRKVGLRNEEWLLVLLLVVVTVVVVEVA